MQYVEEEKKMWLEDVRQSGKSAWSYAKVNGLNPQTFVKWTKVEQEPEVGTCLVEVPANHGTAHTSVGDTHREG